MIYWFIPLQWANQFLSWIVLTYLTRHCHLTLDLKWFSLSITCSVNRTKSWVGDHLKKRVFDSFKRPITIWIVIFFKIDSQGNRKLSLLFAVPGGRINEFIFQHERNRFVMIYLFYNWATAHWQHLTSIYLYILRIKFLFFIERPNLLHFR